MVLNISLARKMLKMFMHIFLKISAYRRNLDEIKYLPFLIKDNELLEKYNEFKGNIKNRIKKEFDSEPVYNENYLSTKRKSYNGKINTNFHKNKIPKERSQFSCLSLIYIKINDKQLN